MPVARIAIAALLLPFGLSKHNGATAAGVALIVIAIVLTVAASPTWSKK
jgi:membrane-bound ClpP family serine protease